MPTLISLDAVTQRIGAKLLFQDLKLALDDKTHLGVIGPNGSGKSTLLKILAGNIIPDEGRVIQNKGVRIAYVPQEVQFDLDQTIREGMVQELSNYYSPHEANIQASIYLSKYDFENPEEKIQNLSGGWRKRLSLAAALAKEADLILFDEPTNHLDLSGMLWLEKLLLEAKFAWVVISHDRHFLEKTVSEVIEINPIYRQGILKLTGNYSTFLEKRADFLEQEERGIESLSNKVRNETEWASRSPKARTTKANYRLKEVDRLHSELKERKSRQLKEKAKISFTSSQRETKELVELINVSFGFGKDDIIKQQNLLLTSGRCLGILGTNGQGKSTLLKLIGGELLPNQGKIKHAPFLKIVYFDQLRKSIDPNQTLRRAIADGSDQVVYQDKPIHIISWAKRFNFEISDLEKTIASLSGGEQARLLLSILVRQTADLLILDEPTNDLDLPMLEMLESMLVEFPGAIALVTHDRYMIERVCTDFLGFTDQQLLISYASYQQWEDARKNLSEKKNNQLKISIKNKKNSVETQKEIIQIEKKIVRAEADLEKIMEKAGDPALHSNHQASQKINQEIKEAKNKVEALYARWEELEGS